MKYEEGIFWGDRTMRVRRGSDFFFFLVCVLNDVGGINLTTGVLNGEGK